MDGVTTQKGVTIRVNKILNPKSFFCGQQLMAQNRILKGSGWTTSEMGDRH
jgi:hypothetical protein